MNYEEKYIRTLSNDREPSNCDRIIYKSGSDIKFSKYSVINDNKLETIKYSDHNMIFSKFKYANEQYLLLSWNMNAFDKDYTNIELLKTQIKNFFMNKLKNIKYLIFNFQESRKDSMFIQASKEVLFHDFKMNLINHQLSYPIFIKNYYVQLLVFSTVPNVKIKESGYKNFIINTDIVNTIKSFFGTKSYVYININNLMIVGTHFPIDTTKSDLGNDLRLVAFKQISEHFTSYKNLIICGDLNFRNINNVDQLDSLLDLQIYNFKEPSKLKEPTYKYLTVG